MWTPRILETRMKSIATFSFALAALACISASHSSGMEQRYPIQDDPRRTAVADFTEGRARIFMTADSLPQFPSKTSYLCPNQRQWRTLDYARVWELAMKGFVRIVPLRKSGSLHQADADPQTLYSEGYIRTYNAVMLHRLGIRHGELFRDYEDLSIHFDIGYDKYMVQVSNEFGQKSSARHTLDWSKYKGAVNTNSGGINESPAMDAKADFQNGAPRVFVAFTGLPCIVGMENQSSRLNFAVLWRLFSEGKLELVILVEKKDGYEQHPLDANSYPLSAIRKYNRESIMDLSEKYPDILNDTATECVLCPAIPDNEPEAVYHRVKPNIIWRKAETTNSR